MTKNMERLRRRILQYARLTKVNIRKTAQCSKIKKLGVPDLRGFTPHLRTIGIHISNSKNTWSVIDSDPWAWHDILHIAFYDYASFHLGLLSWTKKERFLESHLASELFAVLTLDYHGLVHERRGGLAVDLNSKEWSLLQKAIPSLPDLRSYDFFRHLFQCYLSGNDNLLSLSTFEQAIKSKKSVGDILARWVGHEIRYAQKQRDYTALWYQDLFNIKKGGMTVQIENSSVGFAVWDLMNLFCYASDSEWNLHLKSMAKFTKKIKNHFGLLRKYQRSPQQLDFRFTPVEAIHGMQLIETLKKQGTQNPSGTFLFWQILSRMDFAKFSPQDKKAIKDFSEQANAGVPKQNIWKQVQEICLKRFETRSSKPNSQGIATFFLP
ncbi:MAG: hypothetical protein IT289_10555 [Oligoflexia bacterium]|nr:hypothetical protein [Oligoflexia bacterium]